MKSRFSIVLLLSFICVACSPILLASNVAAQTTTDAVETSVVEPELPSFRAQTVDSKVIIGYGTVIGDVDGDGRPDILLADKKQFVWYQNPTWKRHVIAENLTKRDNVCIAARDIDGDGKVEIAVGGQWNPSDTVDSGSVHYLVAPEDRTKKWTAIKLENEPVVHRMRWVKIADEKFALVVAPLHGRANKGGMGVGVKLMAYHKPKDPTNTWQTEVIDDKFHITHNFDVAKLYGKHESILHLGKEGAKAIHYDGQDWIKIPLGGIQGGGEIRSGQYGENISMPPAIGPNGTRSANAGKTHSSQQKFIATIEPFHGTDLVLYTPGVFTKNQYEGLFKGINPGPIPYNRLVLDKDLNQGHAVAVADMLGNGSQQIVAGWRKPNDDGKFGVKLYYQIDTTGKPWAPSPWANRPWKSVFIDENEMACEDLRIADLNNDGRPDIVASGRSTHNLKIYWNEKPKTDD